MNGLWVWRSNGEQRAVSVGVFLSEDRHPTWMMTLNMAISDFYSIHPDYATRIVFHPTNSTDQLLPTAAAAAHLINDAGVQAIIGPPTSMQAPFLISLGEETHTPIITFSATNPALTAVRRPYFFRATQNDSTQTRAISALMQNFNWGQAVPIYEDNEFGQGILPPLADALVDINARIPYRCGISATATDDRIRGELLNLISMPTRVFVVHMEPHLGGRVFRMAKTMGMMAPGYVWIITDALTNTLHFLDSSVIDSMQGVLGLRPWLKASQKRDFEKRFREKNHGVLPLKLNVYDFWGYDTATALAMAVEEIGSERFKNKTTTKSSSDIEHLPVSSNGPLFLKALSEVSVKGVMGNFKFVNGEIPPASYEVVNINGAGVRTIGLWKRVNGLASLQPIIWPGGDKKPTPKGWMLPTEGKRLKILIPIPEPENHFVIVPKNSKENATLVTGFSIEIFRRAVDSLNYGLPYDFVFFENTNGKPAGTYDDMLMEVYWKKYDGAVGDITITDKRSKNVDFTMPYTVSGVSIVFRASYGRTNNPRIFFSPFSGTLWMACLLSFPFIASVIWFLERNISKKWSGSVAQQLRKPIWYSTIRMISAYGDNLESDYTRIVVVVWGFVIMTLIQSYTASLASLLTVEKLNQISMDVSDLVKNNKSVGYPSPSFVYGMMLQLRFHPYQLIPYDSMDECHRLFENGTIVAAIDETPYLEVLLSNHCNKYATKSVLKTLGFGFVFPKGSPLTNDVSTAILQVVMNRSHLDSEKKWLEPRRKCPVRLESSTLGFKSFLPHFSVVAATAFLAVFISSLQNFLSLRKSTHARLHAHPLNLDHDPRIIALRD